MTNPAPNRSAIGSHVTVGGGLVKTGLSEAIAISAEAIQIFMGNPRGWVPSFGDKATEADFRQLCEEMDIPVFVHAPHLINLGSPSIAVQERSAGALAHQLLRAASIGAKAVVMHAGSSVLPLRRDTALKQVRERISRILDTAPAKIRLLVEPTAGGGEALASSVESTIEYLDALDDERVGVCADTCHLHASGEDLQSPDAFARTFEGLVAGIGPDRLGLIHVNDSMDARGTLRDRHQSLGNGPIGAFSFSAAFTTPALLGIPLIVETPTHLEDVALLKRLRNRQYESDASETRTRTV